MTDRDSYFTLVFEGDIRKLDLNPFLTDTPFGRPVVAGVGNAFDEIDRLEAEMERLDDTRSPSPPSSTGRSE